MRREKNCETKLGTFWSLTFPRKHFLVPQNTSRILGLEKLPKTESCVRNKEIERNSDGGPTGIGGCSPISKWINPPSLGSNGPHCVEFLHEMGKLLLNLVPGKTLALV